MRRVAPGAEVVIDLLHAQSPHRGWTAQQYGDEFVGSHRVGHPYPHGGSGGYGDPLGQLLNRRGTAEADDVDES
ncbi:MAG: hypothetical protein V9F04_11440 [Dermatophilaceae bacterium]